MVGADEGLDFVELRLTEYTTPGERQPTLYLTACNVKTATWPEPPGLQSECWHTGFGPQELSVRQFVSSPQQIRFTGAVEMFCTFPGSCGGVTERTVNVDLE